MAPQAMPRPPTAEPDDYRWLVAPETAALLSNVASWHEPLVTQAAQLRRQLSPARTHLLLEQIALRERGRAKFSIADRMFFTPLGLEQSSDEIVADYKASRFAAQDPTFDLCCGIGGDLLALGRRSQTTGFDRDPNVAIIAEANGRLIAVDGERGLAVACPTVSVRDVDEIDLTECRAWHIDPDRRPRGRRTTHVELHEPDLATLERLLARNRNAAIKLAPAAEPPDAWLRDAELEWISRARQCRQLVAWFGELAGQPGQRRATVLGASATPLRTIVGVPREEPPAIGRMDAYLFEPDAAVLAAGLDGALAAEHGLAPITPGIAYWSGPRPIDDAAMSCFEVHETLPLDLKRLTALLRAHNVGRLEIKKRGVDHDPQTLRRQLAPAGDESATLLLLKIAGRVTAIVGRRMVATS